LIYTTSSKKELIGIFMPFVYEGYGYEPNKKLKIAVENNLSYRSITCKEIYDMSSELLPKKETACVVIHEGNNIKNFSFEVTQIEKGVISLKVTNEKTYNNYKDFVPLMVDFELDKMVVKARSYDNEGKPKSEAMLFYQRDNRLTEDLYWGMKPVEYYNDWKESQSSTDSIPLLYVEKFEGLEKTIVYLRYT
jgi:hypothetical protein